MDKKRRMRRTNPVFVLFILGIIGMVLYFNQFVITELPVAQKPTPTATPVPEMLENQADQLAADGTYFQAIDVYKQAIIANPTDPNLHIKLAHTQNLAGDYSAAETSAQNALLLNPDNPKALAELGWTLTLLNDYLGAEEALTKGLELNPDSVEVNAYYAVLLVDEQDFENAAIYSRRATELDDRSLVALYARGYVLYYTGNYEQAASMLESAIEQNSRVANLHILLGLCYWDMNRDDDAIDQFNEADRLDPENPDPDTYIYRIYLRNGEFAKAAQFAQSAVDNDPQSPERWADLGSALYKNQQFPEAIDAFNYAIHGGTTPTGVVVQGISLNYDNDLYFERFGLALANTRQCDQALQIVQGLRTVVPGDEIAMDNADAIEEICAGYINEPTPEPTETPNP